MKARSIILLIGFVVLLAKGENAVSPTNVTQESTTPSTTTTTRKPVDPNTITICKKCHCDVEKKTLNCFNTLLSKWFSNDEWQLLKDTGIQFEIFRFDSNKLTEVPAFPEFPIKKLMLSHNNIASIAESAFKDLKNLESLDLSNNSLTSDKLTPKCFQGNYKPTIYEPLENLRELNLGRNELHSLDADLFEHFPNLESLTLAENVFKVIDQVTQTALTDIKQLKYLDMSNMELRKLPSDLLHTPRNLEILKLGGNLFDKVPKKVLSLAVNLKELNLDENPIVTVDGEDVFPNMTKLEILSMSYMEVLTSFGSGAFSGLNNLKVFRATNNPHLSSIHRDAFSANNSYDLNLYPLIRKLYLHNNNLSTLNNEMLARWDRVQELDLRFNPWSCECENQWIIDELFAQIARETPTLKDDLTCATPYQMYGHTFEMIHAKNTLMRCKDTYNNRPERDGAILIGVLIGVLVGIPLTFIVMLLYRRGCFGLVRGSGPGDSNRAFYKRAELQEDYHI